MARSRNILTDADIRSALATQKARLKELKIDGPPLAEKLKDGGSLHLSPTLRWVYEYRFRGKDRETRLGEYPGLTLAKARVERDRLERQRKEDGVDPNAVKRREKALNRGLTFREFALENADTLGWPSKAARKRWLKVMTTPQYLKGFIDLTPNEIRAEHVEDALRPYWTAQPATSIQLRRCIRRVLQAARAKKLIAGMVWENPAVFRDGLEHTMPSSAYVSEPRKSLPWQEAPVFLTKLRRKGNIESLAVEWLILTGMRVEAVIGARWDEIDLRKRTWTVPADRMKGEEGKVGKHVAPLTKPMVRVLRKLRKLGVRRDSEFLFASRRSKTGHICSSTVWNYVHRIAAYDACPHGFRSTVSTWAEEETDAHETVITMTVGHVKKDKIHRVYGRSDMLRRRRELMEAWGRYCAEPRYPQPAALRIAA